MLLFPVLFIFSTACSIFSGDRNCPFFMLIVLPVSPAAINRSVCLHKKAGICNTSTTSATILHCSGQCTSVKTGTLFFSFTSDNISSPFSTFGPLNEFKDVLLALSKELLKITGNPNRSVIDFTDSDIFKL